MKVHLYYKSVRSPSGGGNQFLKALDNVIASKGIRVDSLINADIVLFNSHHNITNTSFAKLRFPKKIFIHRIDGPMRLYNSWSDKRDHIVNMANTMIADGTIFQSNWSRVENYRLNLNRNLFDIVINNAVDPDLFNRIGKKPFSMDRKIMLIATSWSPNPRKGFDVYDWLDRHLDFSRFEMTFIGNSPIKFRNIKHVEPLATEALARILKKQDIFIFASKFEACSNSLIEALHCGLPAIAYNSSSNPEIIGRSGELFENPADIPALLDKVVGKYLEYQDKISLPSIEVVTKKYMEFMQNIYDRSKAGRYTPKRITTVEFIAIIIKLFAVRVRGKLTGRTE